MDVRDAHLIPEAILAAEEYSVGNRWQILNNDDAGLERIARLNKLAKAGNNPSAADVMNFMQLVDDDDAAIRWWAVTGLTNGVDRLPNAKDVQYKLRTVLASVTQDRSPAVRIAAARALHKTRRTNEAVDLLIGELDDESEFVRHAAILEIDEIGPKASAARDAVQKLAGKKGYISDLANHALSQFSP